MFGTSTSSTAAFSTGTTSGLSTFLGHLLEPCPSLHPASFGWEPMVVWIRDILSVGEHPQFSMLLISSLLFIWSQWQLWQTKENETSRKENNLDAQILFRVFYRITTALVCQALRYLKSRLLCYTPALWLLKRSHLVLSTPKSLHQSRNYTNLGMMWSKNFLVHD